MTRFYPTIDPVALTALRTIRKLASQDPGYLTDPECPYAPEDLFFVTSYPETNTPASEEIGDLDTEVDALFRYVKGLKPATVSEANKESLDWARIASSLMEKLIGLRERAAKVKDVVKFQDTVMSFLEDICSPEQRTRFMDMVEQNA